MSEKLITELFCFDFLPKEDEEPGRAHLWIAENSTNRAAWVSNIIPIGKSSLNQAQYNTILIDFLEKVVKPACSELGLKIELGPDELGLLNYIDEETAVALQSFSGAANKSTGASHPSDRARWEHFLCLHHIRGFELPVDQLEFWLQEDGWDWEQTSDLAIGFERAMSLLKSYDLARK